MSSIFCCSNTSPYKSRILDNEPKLLNTTTDTFVEVNEQWLIDNNLKKLNA